MVNAAAKTAGSVLFDTAGAALYLTIGKRSLEKWRQTGEGPRFIKIGGAVRYTTEDLDAFIKANRRSSTSENARAQPP
jgi:hypothetical protein